MNNNIMSQQTYPEQNNFNALNIFKLIFKNMWIIIPCVILALGIAYVYNKYTIPIYKVSSILLLKESSENNTSNGESRFINSELLAQNQNLKNELEIIQSYPTIEQMVKNLDLKVSYYEYKDYQYFNAYKAAPFKVFIFKEHPQLVGAIFDINFNSDGSYDLKFKKQNAIVYSYSTEQKIDERKNLELNLKGNVGQIIETDDFKFLITINDKDYLSLMDKRPFAFKLSTIKQLINQFETSLEFNIPDKLATVIEISMETTSVQQGEDIINELIDVYSASNLEKKNHLASMTIEYIKNQLDEVTASLNRTGDNLQKFMSESKTMNVNEQSTRLSQQRLDLQNQLAELLNRKRYYDYVTEYNNNNTDETQIIAPTSMGVKDPSLSNLIGELSSAQIQRANLIKNNQERNPIVARLDIQIKNLKNTISENIAAAKRSNDISITEMQNRIGKIEREIGGLPETQIQMGGIERNYNLNSAVYNYLLEKQAEAKITKASNLPDNIVVEPPHMVGIKPIFPKKRDNYLMAILLGLVLPFSYIIVKSSLNNKIEKQDDIERLTQKPLLGKILHSRYKVANVMFEFPKSNIAESFRALRTNLDFYGTGRQKKVVMVTSCLQGEGKTFVARNLAMSYAQLGRKTILVNFDLRKFETYFKDNEESKDGLSSYMINKVNLEDVIVKSPHDNLDYILSGILPPNPVELIALNKTEEILTMLKEDYDIIILDTTPLAEVTDAYLLVDYADLKILVVRQNYTLKNVFSLIMKDLQLKDISNVCIVLNDNRIYDDQYGYGYGYNNGNRKREKRRMENPLLRKVLNRILRK